MRDLAEVFRLYGAGEIPWNDALSWIMANVTSQTNIGNPIGTEEGIAMLNAGIAFMEGGGDAAQASAAAIGGDPRIFNPLLPPPAAPVAAPVAAPPVAGPVALDRPQRAADTEQQEEDQPFDVFRRFQLGREGFGGVPSFLRERLLTDRRASDAFARFNISGLGMPIPGASDPGRGGMTFFDFLGQQAPGQTSEELRRGLGEISSILSQDPSGFNAVQLARAAPFETPGQQFTGAVQPFLADMTPSLREPFRRMATKQFTNFRSLFPGQNYLPFAQQRGFF